MNEVAIRIKRDVRTIEHWCERGLLHSTALAGGYGGVWVAVTDEGWPMDGPNVEAYSETRSEVCRQREASRKAARENPEPAESTKKARRRKQT